ncbi:hypothetical protein ACHQM5_009208 [Ranunculus cassubicifolius]
MGPRTILQLGSEICNQHVLTTRIPSLIRRMKCSYNSYCSSNELPSIQMTHCFSENCVFCFKRVEMNTVHPQRNVVKEENELTEYEFFSSSASSSNCSGSSWLNRDRDSSSVMWGGEASGSASPTTPTTHFLDLSRKLSC